MTRRILPAAAGIFFVLVVVFPSVLGSTIDINLTRSSPCYWDTGNGSMPYFTVSGGFSPSKFPIGSLTNWQSCLPGVQVSLAQYRSSPSDTRAKTVFINSRGLNETGSGTVPFSGTYTVLSLRFNRTLAWGGGNVSYHVVYSDASTGLLDSGGFLSQNNANVSALASGTVLGGPGQDYYLSESSPSSVAFDTLTMLYIYTTPQVDILIDRIVLYNITDTSGNSLPSVNLTASGSGIGYMNESSVCGFDINVSAFDPEGDTVLYSKATNAIVRGTQGTISFDQPVPQYAGFLPLGNSPSPASFDKLTYINQAQSCVYGMNLTGATHGYIQPIYPLDGYQPYAYALNPFCTGTDKRVLVDLGQSMSYPGIEVDFLNDAPLNLNITLKSTLNFSRNFNYRLRWSGISGDNLSVEIQNGSSFILLLNESNPTQRGMMNSRVYVGYLPVSIDSSAVQYFPGAMLTIGGYWQESRTTVNPVYRQSILNISSLTNSTRYVSFTSQNFVYIRGLTYVGTSPALVQNWTSTIPLTHVDLNGVGTFNVGFSYTDSVNALRGNYATASLALVCRSSDLAMNDPRLSTPATTDQMGGIGGFFRFLYTYGGFLRSFPEVAKYYGAAWGSLYFLLFAYIWIVDDQMKNPLRALKISSAITGFIAFLMLPIGYLINSVVIFALAMVPDMLAMNAPASHSQEERP